MNTTKQSITALTLGALGVVFGDIGTSPLYALHAVFGQGGYHLPITQATIFGIISLIIWSVTLVVSIKFIGFIMQADNEGEGGIMALVAEVKGGKLQGQAKWLFILLGLVGVSLFYGDSTITPAISVLSAIEGLRVVAPHLDTFIVPITLAILAALFAIQRFGTSLIGRLFGPIMLIWFIVIALGGVLQIWQHPDILITLSPLTALTFFAAQPAIAFVAMGAVVLAITGAEALYADMGHFGRPPIARAWFLIVFPALLLCYMGQGVLLLHNPEAATNPFILLYPEAYRLPILLLATMATVIASQSVISGAFSLTRQAVQLNFLPKMAIRHTSAREGGQIYLPLVNALLFITVSLLVVLFGSSAKLASAYGIAVSGTLAADTLLYLVLMRSKWHKPLWNIFIVSLIFLPIDLLFIASTLPKVLQGGWFPIIIGSIVYAIITTWLKGQIIVAAERKALEGPLQGFIDTIHYQNPPISRVPGTAVFIAHHPGFAPLAVHATVEDLHELPEKVIIVSVEITTASHVPEHRRAVFDDLGFDDGIIYVQLSYGFHDSPNIPSTLKALHHMNHEFDLDLDKASYFISLSRIVPSKRHNLSPWRKYLYCIMARNAISTSDYYKLPIERTVEMSSLIKL